MTLIDILEASIIVSTACGIVYALVTKLYDHIRDVETLKKESDAFRKSERTVNQKIFSTLTSNQRAIAHVEKVLKYVLKTQALTKREIIKVAMKLNATEPEFDQNDD